MKIKIVRAQPMVAAFRIDLACEYGLDVAVFVSELAQRIHVQTEYAKMGDTHAGYQTITNKGLAYIALTLDDLQKEFPWWSQRQLQRIKGKAVQAGLICQGCFNQNPWDRRLWYAVC